MLSRALALGLLLSCFLGVPGSAKEKIKLMYLESKDEERTAVLINRLDVPLEVHRIGIFRVGPDLYGVVRFGVVQPSGALADKHRVGATVAMLSDRIFGELPDLVRIDFEGVSQRETKQKKPDVLFSSSVDRNSWKTVPKALTPLSRVEMAGVLYFDPKIALGEPMKPKAPPAKGVKVKVKGQADLAKGKADKGQGKDKVGQSKSKADKVKSTAVKADKAKGKAKAKTRDNPAKKESHKS